MADNASQQSKFSNKSLARNGKGTYHCLHPDCIGKNPVTRRRNHAVHGKENTNFQECGGETCTLCQTRAVANQGLLIQNCPKCFKKFRSDKLKRHLPTCEKEKLHEPEQPIVMLDDTQEIDKLSVNSMQFYPQQQQVQEALHGLEDNEAVEVDQHLNVSSFAQQYTSSHIGACNSYSRPQEISNPSQSKRQRTGDFSTDNVPCTASVSEYKQLDSANLAIQNDAIAWKEAENIAFTALRAQKKLHLQNQAALLDCINKTKKTKIAQLKNNLFQEVNQEAEILVHSIQKLQTSVSKLEPIQEIVLNVDAQLKEVEETRTFEDCSSWQTKFRQMSALTEEAERWCTPRVELIENAMRGINFKPNNNQLGVSIFALHKVLKCSTKKLFFQAPSGKGKSRIIGGIIVGAIQNTTTIDKVIVVFPSEILKKTDEPIFKGLEYYGENNAKRSVGVECVVGLKEALGKTNVRTLFIIDEADYCLLDDGKVNLPLQSKFKAIIAFSASLPFNDGFDTMKIAEYGFTVQDTHIPGALNGSDVVRTNIKDFIAQNPLRAKLVFTSEERKPSIEELTTSKEWNVHVNTQDLDIIQHLTSNDFLSVTDQILMRGVDYRCKTGIDLFIDAPLRNERAYIQALGRVGRCDDECSRYVRSDLDAKFETAERVLRPVFKQTTIPFLTTLTDTKEDKVSSHL